MIEGLKVTIDGKELALRCAERARYHAERTKEYEARLESLVALGSHGSMNPVEQAKDKIEEHKGLAAEMQFIAEHIDQREVFILDGNDLFKLGVSYHSY